MQELRQRAPRCRRPWRRNSRGEEEVNSMAPTDRPETDDRLQGDVEDGAAKDEKAAQKLSMDVKIDTKSAANGTSPSRFRMTRSTLLLAMLLAS